MNDTTAREPDAVESTERSSAGTASSGARERPGDEVRPNYDEREERISTTRKPAGPPLEEGTARAGPGAGDETETEPEPTDPE